MSKTIDEMRNELKRYIHESVPALEFISDMELCSLADYDEIVARATKNIDEASDSTIEEWYKDWCSD